MDLTFGWRTAVLTTAAGVLLPLARALWVSFCNQVAARTLAALLVVMTGTLVPWLLGFAGFYDQWRWLTFLPVSNALLAPPLLYLHAHALVNGCWPQRGWRHLLPGLAQFGYQTTCFLLPMPAKHLWASASFDAFDTLIAVAMAVSFAGYGTAILRLLRGYRRALAAERSDGERFATAWITRSTVAFGALALVWAGFLLVNAATPLGYRGLMPLYLAIAAFALYLGIAGWRHLALPFPVLAELTMQVAASEPPVRDWRAQGEAWAERTRQLGWYREETLTLRRLATLLGTNESYLSRALNDGLGVGFSEFVNGLRCEDVAAALLAGDSRPVLTIALEAGFASKPSFNRAFQRRYGRSPTAMRTAQKT